MIAVSSTSAGAMTGAMGILVAVSKDVGELAAPGSHRAHILISLIVALGIGFMNGFLVEKTCSRASRSRCAPTTC